jgi:hypothetical protein
MAALKNSLFGEYLSVQQLFVILPYSPFPYLPTKVVKKMQTVYILSGKIGEMKNEKTKWFAGLPVWRFAMRRSIPLRNPSNQFCHFPF